MLKHVCDNGHKEYASFYFFPLACEYIFASKDDSLVRIRFGCRTVGEKGKLYQINSAWGGIEVLGSNQSVGRY